jgi:hypothetical protein
MSFETGLYGLLSAAPTLVALQAARVFPVIVPEGEVMPCTTYHVVGGSQTPIFGTSGMQRRRVQLDFRANGYPAANQLRSATIGVLNGFSGPLPNGFLIADCWLIQPIDYFDNDARQFRCSAEFYFDFAIQGA